MKVNILVIGLGSMGKRRIRCLKHLCVANVYGFDLRQDRALEVEKTYGVKTFTKFEEACQSAQPNILIISVGPAQHLEYMQYAVKNNLHFFVEASVLDHGLLEIIGQLKTKNLVAAPSATLLFHPAIKIIKSIVKKGDLGKISNVLFHSGQYLPDWHTYEAVSDFYVSDPATGGAREIVPFEMAWFTDVFGYPAKVMGNVRKTIDIKGAEYIDDTYNVLLDYKTFLASVTVDVVSRVASRKLVVNGDKKQLVWSWDENCVKIFDPDQQEWDVIDYDLGAAHAGYNKNIAETMYIDEIECFLNAIKGGGNFINSLYKDYQVLQLLYKIEQSDLSSRAVLV